MDRREFLKQAGGILSAGAVAGAASAVGGTASPKPVAVPRNLHGIELPEFDFAGLKGLGGRLLLEPPVPEDKVIELDPPKFGDELRGDYLRMVYAESLTEEERKRHRMGFVLQITNFIDVGPEGGAVLYFADLFGNVFRTRLNDVRVGGTYWSPDSGRSRYRYFEHLGSTFFKDLKDGTRHSLIFDIKLLFRSLRDIDYCVLVRSSPESSAEVNEPGSRALERTGKVRSFALVTGRLSNGIKSGDPAVPHVGMFIEEDAGGSAIGVYDVGVNFGRHGGLDIQISSLLYSRYLHPESDE